LPAVISIPGLAGNCSSLAEDRGEKQDLKFYPSKFRAMWLFCALPSAAAISVPAKQKGWILFPDNGKKPKRTT
jgi:hypothetical protein